jgi:hypothetical protein
VVDDTLLARASRAGLEWGDCTGPQNRLEDSFDEEYRAA